LKKIDFLEPDTLKEFFAGFVSLFLVAGLVVLAIVDREIPPSLSMALGSSMTWLFIRTAERSSNQTSFQPPELAHDRVQAWGPANCAEIAPLSNAESVGRRSPSEYR